MHFPAFELPASIRLSIACCLFLSLVNQRIGAQDAGALAASASFREDEPRLRGLDANLYMQTSAEYRAACYGQRAIAPLETMTTLFWASWSARIARARRAWALSSRARVLEPILTTIRFALRIAARSTRPSGADVM